MIEIKKNKKGIVFLIIDTEGKTKEQLKNEVKEIVEKQFDGAISALSKAYNNSSDNYEKIMKSVREEKEKETKEMLRQFYFQIDSLKD